MTKNGEELVLLAEALMATRIEEMPKRERAVVDRAAKRLAVSRPVHREFEKSLTFGQRLADHVAIIGGSWWFISGFGLFLICWAILNTAMLVRPFDAYPFIFLNLLLSMLAAIQAPIIMMSQNRQAARDRVQAGQDFEINLKAELEILALHVKIDRLITRLEHSNQLPSAP
jgi:uncharacterized membrane protein